MQKKLCLVLSVMALGLLYGGVDGDYMCNIDSSLTGKTVGKSVPSSAYTYKCNQDLLVPDCNSNFCHSYIYCQCTNTSTGNAPAVTGCWRPGAKLTTDDGKCINDVAIGTAVAVFNNDGTYASQTCGAFMGCKDENTLMVFIQSCHTNLRTVEVVDSSLIYRSFYVVENGGVVNPAVPPEDQFGCVEQPSLVSNCTQTNFNSLLCKLLNLIGYKG